MSKPELSDINIIRANINLEPLHRIAAQYGFEATRDPVKLSPWERVHRFGENILYWLLTLACNSGRVRPNKFWRCRQLMYLSRRTLDCKHIAARPRGQRPNVAGVLPKLALQGTWGRPRTPGGRMGPIRKKGTQKYKRGVESQTRLRVFP
jgi:hypothetical protein